MIETERLVLRPPQPDDLVWYLEQLNTPAVMRNLGGVRSEAEASQGFARDHATAGDSPAGAYIILHKDSGMRIGKCGLFPITEPAAPAALHGAMQLGWSLAESFWGQGFATEAARALIAHAFERTSETVLWAQTSDSNAPSTRMMARLGLTYRADLDYIDPYYPAVDNPTRVYRLDRQSAPADGT